MKAAMPPSSTAPQITTCMGLSALVTVGNGAAGRGSRDGGGASATDHGMLRPG